MSSLWVMAESGAARYFQSAFFAHCLSAGYGVPLHTLMLITATKRMYLVNGYSVVKEPSRFCHKGKQVKGFLSPFTCLLTHQRLRVVQILKNLKILFQLFNRNIHAEFYRPFRAALQLRNLLIGQLPEKIQLQPASLHFWKFGNRPM